MDTTIVYLEQSDNLTKEDTLQKVAEIGTWASMYTWSNRIVDAIKSYDQVYAMLPPSSKETSDKTSLIRAVATVDARHV